MAKSLLPAGVIVAYGGPVAPSGWLLCDGKLVSRTKYKDLFLAIGTAHGSGNGRTTFALPDHRGRFLRGVDNAASNDPDSTTRTAASTGGNTGDNVGSVQSQATRKNGLTASSVVTDPGHSHTTNAITSGGTWDFSGGSSYGNFATVNSATTGITVSTTISAGDNETRPVNASVHFIIKT